MTSVNAILLIDDDPIVQFINKSFLSKRISCQKFYTASNGEEGLLILESLEANPEKLFPDFIFLDLNMPVKDGFEFLKKYNEKYSGTLNKVKIIVLTTSDASEDKKRVKQLLISDYITKPLTEENFKPIFEKYFSQY